MSLSATRIRSAGEIKYIFLGYVIIRNLQVYPSINSISISQTSIFRRLTKR
ncbi:hypothetical protein BLAT2472_230002 [Burkholderia latens]